MPWIIVNDETKKTPEQFMDADGREPLQFDSKIAAVTALNSYRNFRLYIGAPVKPDEMFGCRVVELQKPKKVVFAIGPFITEPFDVQCDDPVEFLDHAKATALLSEHLDIVGDIVIMSVDGKYVGHNVTVDRQPLAKALVDRINYFGGHVDWAAGVIWFQEREDMYRFSATYTLPIGWSFRADA